MLDVIKGFTEQVTEYSTIFGQIWYLCVFLFRGIVVVTIGGEVYSDEQSEFKCSTIEVGCENVCFAKFSKISHIRFWAFQLLAVSTPTILFHFFVISVKARIEKGKAYTPEICNDSDNWPNEVVAAKDDKLMKRKAKKKELRVRFKTVYDASSNTMKDVEVTDSISGAYYINVLFRAVLEGLFIYFSYGLFKFMNYTDPSEDRTGVFDFVWFSVPMLFKCEGTDISAACHQHTSFGPGGYVPCWVSRPWEKTLFLRYMNILSCLCFILSLLEFIYLSLRGTRTATRRRKKKRNKNNDFFYPSDDLSKIAIPIRMSAIKRYDDGEGSYITVDEEEFHDGRRKMEV